MIFINAENTCGSGRFCFDFMKSIRLQLAQKFSDEQLQDFDNDLEFQKAIWLDELSKDDFNQFAMIAIKAELEDMWQNEQTILIELLKSDPRFKH